MQIYILVNDRGDVDGPVRCSQHKALRPHMRQNEFLLLLVKQTKVFVEFGLLDAGDENLRKKLIVKI